MLLSFCAVCSDIPTLVEQMPAGLWWSLACWLMSLTSGYKRTCGDQDCGEPRLDPNKSVAGSSYQICYVVLQ
jgi:hypothetical protein